MEGIELLFTKIGLIDGTLANNKEITDSKTKKTITLKFLIHLLACLLFHYRSPPKARKHHAPVEVVIVHRDKKSTIKPHLGVLLRYLWFQVEYPLWWRAHLYLHLYNHREAVPYSTQSLDPKLHREQKNLTLPFCKRTFYQHQVHSS